MKKIDLEIYAIDSSSCPIWNLIQKLCYWEALAVAAARFKKLIQKFMLLTAAAARFRNLCFNKVSIVTVTRF